VKVNDSDKDSRFLRIVIKYGRKKLYNTGPRSLKKDCHEWKENLDEKKKFYYGLINSAEKEKGSTNEILNEFVWLKI